MQAHINSAAGFENVNGKEFMLCRSIVRTLQMLVPYWMAHNLEFNEALRSVDMLVVKLSFDARRYGRGKRHNQFTCGGISILNPGMETVWQSERNVVTVAEWQGKDDHENISQWLDMIGAVQYLKYRRLKVKTKDGLEKAYRVHFLICADMAAHWGWFGCGGMGDDMFCHRCKCRKHQRKTLFQLYKPVSGETLSSISLKFDLTVEDLMKLNLSHTDTTGKSVHVQYIHS
jgi:hypothetical protein